VQYRVVRKGTSWLEQAFGLRDVAHAPPVTVLTTFNAYSITKPVTATAALLLADKGKLDLDAPIGSAAGVAGLEDYGTVRETLLHRAGFRNPNPLRWIHLAEDHDTFSESAFVAERIASFRGTGRRPGSGYSNIGYLLLGLAIERAHGRPFIRAIQDLVVDPLELNAEEKLAFAIDRPDLHARGHLRRHGLLDLALGFFIKRSTVVQDIHAQWVRLHLHHVNGSAYGGLIANTRGLTRFAEAVIGSRLGIPAAIREQLLATVPGPGPSRSLGWFGGKLRSQRWLAHAGGGLGYYGELRLYPDLHAVSCLLTNAPGLSDAKCLDEIDAAWLDVE